MTGATGPLDCPSYRETRRLRSYRQLSAGDRRVLGLVAVDGAGPAELAAELGCSTGAATVRLSRARQRLVRAVRGDTGVTHPVPRRPSPRSPT